MTSLNFFSLHHVLRTSPTSFTLKEIEAIYKSTAWTEDDPDYVYKYSDGSFSSESRTGSPLFDLKTTLWPGRNKDNSIYYFEIPVNKGEYVMGAVDYDDTHNGGTNPQSGAYMMYLDIGSNGHSSGNSTLTANYTETTSKIQKVPSGIDFNLSDLSSVGGNSICISLTYADLENMELTLTGSIIFTPGAKVKVNSRISNATCNYDKGNCLDKSESEQTIGDATNAMSAGGQRLIFSTIVTPDEERWELKYKEILDGSGNITGATYSSVIKDGADITSDIISGSVSVPVAFTNNISAIKAKPCAVKLVYFGADFNVTETSFDDENGRVSLTIPPEEIAEYVFDVSYPSGKYNELYINNGEYVAS